jgi:hypothetical protein
MDLGKVIQGLASIVEAISKGELTPQEGELISRILVTSAAVMENPHWENRLE